MVDKGRELAVGLQRIREVRTHGDCGFGLVHGVPEKDIFQSVRYDAEGVHHGNAGSKQCCERPGEGSRVRLDREILHDGQLDLNLRGHVAAGFTLVELADTQHYSHNDGQHYVPVLLQPVG